MTTPTGNQVLGVVDMSYLWYRTNGTTQLIVVPKPTELVKKVNSKFIEGKERSKLGVTNLIALILDEQTPEIDITWSVKTLNLMAAQQGFAFANPGTTPVMSVINRLNCTQAAYLAATSGFEGFGVVADAVSAAAYEDPLQPGINVQMAQQPFATFNPASINSFAVGLNFGLKFSTDMVNPNLLQARQVTISTPNLVSSGLVMSAEAFDTVSLVYNQILADRSIVQTTYAGLTLKPGDVDTKPETKITYANLNPSGGCNVPDVRYLGQLQKRAC